jgi:hypothetical protein
MMVMVMIMIMVGMGMGWVMPHTTISTKPSRLAYQLLERSRAILSTRAIPKT